MSYSATGVVLRVGSKKPRPVAWPGRALPGAVACRPSSGRCSERSPGFADGFVQYPRRAPEVSTDAGLALPFDSKQHSGDPWLLPTFAARRVRENRTHGLKGECALSARVEAAPKTSPASEGTEEGGEGPKDKPRGADRSDLLAKLRHR